MTQPIQHIDGTTGARRHFRYFDYVMAAFVAILLLSNLIGAAKLANIGGFAFGAGVLFFPISYVLGDVLTEVYGFANARRCVWTGFAALAFMTFMSLVVVAMPSDPGWSCDQSRDAAYAALVKQLGPAEVCQSTYKSVFGSTWRLALGSLLAFWAGEFVNSIVLAKLKVLTAGKHLWSRTIGSTFFGQAVDSLIFYPVAFFGIWSNELLVTVMLTNWLLKVLWEAALTPVTYVVVGWLKRREGVDVFDEGTDFSPFAKADAV